jgi:hypothetical protein
MLVLVYGLETAFLGQMTGIALLNNNLHRLQESAGKHPSIFYRYLLPTLDAIQFIISSYISSLVMLDYISTLYSVLSV